MFVSFVVVSIQHTTSRTTGGTYRRFISKYLVLLNVLHADSDTLNVKECIYVYVWKDEEKNRLLTDVNNNVKKTENCLSVTVKKKYINIYGWNWNIREK